MPKPRNPRIAKPRAAGKTADWDPVSAGPPAESVPMPEENTGHRPRKPENKRRQTRAATPQEEPVIFGLHAVEFALRNPDREIQALWLTENAENKLKTALAGNTAPISSVRPKDLDRRLGADTVHQGALAEVAPLPERSLDDLILRTADNGPIILLDQVTDPHNVGAVLRSATVFGAAGLVMTRRHSPPLWGALAKTASGALEQMPVALVQNLSRSIAELKAAGVACYGLDGEAGRTIDGASWSGPVAIVLGAEGKGLRQSTKEACDELLRIPSIGPLASLNVSNAAAVTLYEAARARPR